ncbi:MAG: helicase-related protein, partial [Bacteroidota bacterium]
IDASPGLFGILFCRTRKDTKDVADQLLADGYNADALHGDLSQAQRDSVMQKFRNRNLQILVATDVAARGIDVSNVTHVFHFGFPDDIENYTHRSGRTARAGKSGISVAIISPKDASRIGYIDKQLGVKLQYTKVPSGEDICAAQLQHFSVRINEIQVQEKLIAPHISQISEALADYSREDLLAKILSLELSKYLETYAKTFNINIDPSSTRKSPARGFGERTGRDFSNKFDSKKSRGFERENRPFDREKGPKNDRPSGDRIFINIGEMDGMSKPGLLRYICQETGVSSQHIYKIEVKDAFSFVGVDEKVGHNIVDRLNKKSYNERKLRVEFAEANGKKIR